jgi:hypothetical protein
MRWTPIPTNSGEPANLSPERLTLREAGPVKDAHSIEIPERFLPSVATEGNDLEKGRRPCP